jgi:8-oxo-dGTP diphosphatase
MVRDGDKILIGRRLNSHGHGTWAIPGGRVDPGESFLSTGIRELAEETGIVVDAPAPTPYVFPPTSSSPRVNTPRINAFEQGTMAVVCPREGAHMIVTYVVVDRPEGAEAKVMEKDKCAGWSWAKWSDITSIAHYHEKKMRGEDAVAPTMSSDCPIDPLEDSLFAPFHALALTDHQPQYAKPLDINI